MRDGFLHQQDVFQRVNLYLDRQMDETAEKDFLQEVSANPAVGLALRQEQDFRELLKNNVYRRKASPTLIQSIKEKIRQAPA